MSLHPLKFENGILKALDQRLLPHKEAYLDVKTIEDAFGAIKDMVVRGAPVIGYTGLFGMTLWLKKQTQFTQTDLDKAAEYIKSARPTAVNLAYEVDKLVQSILSWKHQDNIWEKSLAYTLETINSAEEKNLSMAKFAEIALAERKLNNDLTILTHCNTGFLACGTLGTALGVISYLNKLKKIKHVFADETRPYLQGSRLTSYELTKENISHQIVVEGAASYLMSNGMVDAIFVGADRIALNGDTANKIGTSNLAHIAKYYNVPFYVVAPLSSFDLSIASGKEIEIEMRPESEILQYKNDPIAPMTARALNPSFDVTPAHLITGIINERGCFSYPYVENFKKLK
jgi:methylthioribose-1-phosphate isomerase